MPSTENITKEAVRVKETSALTTPTKAKSAHVAAERGGIV